MGLSLFLMFVSLGIILIGAEIFTNGIEWFGKKLNLSEGAVGSILAAVGTALPEAMIPVIAILFTHPDAGGSNHDIGIGAILGAPFMLSTLAMFITGSAVIFNKRKRNNYRIMDINQKIVMRDISFFFLSFILAILAAYIDNFNLKILIVILLIGNYSYYVYLNLFEKKEHEDSELNPLILRRNNPNPTIAIISLQIILALALIIIGANIFIKYIEVLARAFDIPPFVLSLIIAPVATELPEKLNSVIWINKGKDTLALGNITGAMVFQSSLIPCFGILFTDWNLTLGALLSALLTLLSAFTIYIQIKIKNHLSPYTLLTGGIYYLIFIILVFFKVIH